MATHVFTQNASYYTRLRVVDFIIGQKVDPEIAVPDKAVRESYLRDGILKELEKVAPTPAPVVVPERAEGPVEEAHPEPITAAPVAPVAEVVKGKGRKA